MNDKQCEVYASTAEYRHSLCCTKHSAHDLFDNRISLFFGQTSA